jgi:HD-like signal output (HDOD) protein
MSDSESLVASALQLFLRRISSGDYEPPLMPDTVRRAMDLGQNRQASFDELGLVVRTDPAFAAQLLRLANSPLFGGREPVANLSAALGRIGLTGLRELLLAASMNEILVVPGDPGLSVRLQRRGLAVAVCAQVLAEDTDLDTEDAFTGGILHDLGLPLAFGLIYVYRRKLPQSLVSSPELQRVLAEQVHTALGEELGRAWRLPTALVEVLGQHHDPGSPAGDRSLVRCVTAARTLADQLGMEPEGLPTPEHCPAFEALGIGLERAQELAAEAASRLS